MDHLNNQITVAGRLEGRPVPGHEVMNERFYTGTLAVKRLSGAIDRLPVTIPGRLVSLLPEDPDALLSVGGQVRSWNRLVEGASRLMVTLFVQEISPSADDDSLNRAMLTGTLCRPPVFRYTPFGREICDMMVTVPRGFGKSDCIPCIAWGRNARYAAQFGTGDRLRLTGRLQSREYRKQRENGEYTSRFAYELSCFTLEAAREAQPDLRKDGMAASPGSFENALPSHENSPFCLLFKGNML